jgi:archaeoflavoprotein AfpA
LKVAWGITGCGDKLEETVNIMKGLKEEHGPSLRIEVFLSKAALKVVKKYRIVDQLKSSFDSYMVEIDSNSPFLAGRLQTGEFDSLVIAPASGNTVAKIAVGIADTLLTNSVIQAIKGFTPVYIMPTDFEEGIMETILPKGKILRLKIRKEDAENVRKLNKMEGITIFKNPRCLNVILHPN